MAYILCIAFMPLSFLWTLTRFWWLDMYIMCGVYITSFPLQYCSVDSISKAISLNHFANVAYYLCIRREWRHTPPASPRQYILVPTPPHPQGGPAALGPEAPLPPPPAALHPRPRPPAVGPQQLLFQPQFWWGMPSNALCLVSVVHQVHLDS